MKKLLLFILFPCTAFAQKEFKINGNISGLKDSALVFITDAQGNTIAQNYAINGKFTLQGSTETVSYFQLGCIGLTDVYELFLGNENVNINGTATNFKKATSTGSLSQIEYTSFINNFLPINEKITAIIGPLNAEKDAYKKDSMVKQFESYKTKVKELVSKFISEKPSSAVSSFVLLQFYQLLGDEKLLEQKYKTFKGDARKGLFANLIEQKILANSKPATGSVGSLAAEFTQNNETDKPISLSSFKGKYVLLDFWASWCGPCRKENPNVVAAFNKYKNKNFTILGISLDSQKPNWIKAIADDGLTWPQVSDLKGWQNAVAQMYQVGSIPQNYLLDPTGKIIAINLRGEELEKKLEEVLK